MTDTQQDNPRGNVVAVTLGEDPSVAGRAVFDQIRALDDFEPPEDLWAEVRERASAKQPWFQRAPLAVAAAVCAAVIAGIVLMQPQSPSPAQPTNNVASNDWAALVDRSQQLEGKVLGGTVPSAYRFNATQASLAYRIADVDEQLNALGELPDEQRAETQRDTEALLRQRVELLEALLAEELARRDAQTF